MHPGEDFPHAVQPGRVQIQRQARALCVGTLDQPRVAELVGVLSGIVPDAEPGIVLRRTDRPRLPAMTCPSAGPPSCVSVTSSVATGDMGMLVTA